MERKRTFGIEKPSKCAGSDYESICQGRLNFLVARDKWKSKYLPLALYNVQHAMPSICHRLHW